MKNKRLILSSFLIILVVSLSVSVSFPISAGAISKLKMKSKLIIPVKTVYQLKVSGAGNKKIKWKTSDKKIVYVSAKGKIKAKKEGKAVITAKVGSKSLKCKVTVKTLLIAHRGFSSEYPENTKYAFEGAFEKGFDGVECDIWEAKNGDIMVFHDENAKRLTGIDKDIRKINTTNRDKYPIIKGANIDAYSSDKVLIPTLKETLKIIKEHKGMLFLHIKASENKNLSEKGVKKVSSLLKKYLPLKNVMIIGRKKQILPFKNEGFDVSLNISPADKDDFKDEIRWCIKKGINKILPIEKDDITSVCSIKTLGNYCRRKGFDFGLYSTEDKKTLDKLAQNGALFAISDYWLR